MRKFRFYWYDGGVSVGEGNDAQHAFRRLGFKDFGVVRHYEELK